MLTAEQIDYRASVRAALARRPRPLVGDDLDAWTKAFRASLIELGGFGLLIPERRGGSGGSFVDMLVFLEEIGQVGVDRWFISSAVFATLLLNQEEERPVGRSLLSDVASGNRLVTVAVTESDGSYEIDSISGTAIKTNFGFALSGTKCFVPAAHHADAMIVALRKEWLTDTIGLFLVDRDEDGVTVDQSDPGSINGFATVRLDRVPVRTCRELTLDLTTETFDDLLSFSAVAVCAEMVGGAQRVLEMTVEHASTREQFGVPIGAFEMVQHHCVQIRGDVQAARAITYRARAELSKPGQLIAIAWHRSLKRGQVAVTVALLMSPRACMEQSASAKNTVCIALLGHKWIHGPFGATRNSTQRELLINCERSNLMPGANKVPEVEGLFVSCGVGDQVRLVLGKCKECAATFYPKHAELHRPGCSGGSIDEQLLSPFGTLVSYTVQHFQPPWPYPEPEKWQPVGMGTAVFEEGVQIPAQIVGWDLEKLRVGLKVEVVADVLHIDEDGVERLTWKFRPVANVTSTDDKGNE